MTLVRDFKCWRLWYQGPPLARGLYVYRTRWDYPRVWTRRVDGAILLGIRTHYISWCWRYDR